jgi:hypothetical protein
VAIVSISRIQIRRGRKSQGSGLPQLAGGELGWAVDTQELFIGNGAVSEGAPAVGNSKVLTEHDNLFTLSDQYTYRNGSNVQTGASAATPIQRSLQSRLDDIVSARSFGANGDGTDQTVAIQRAIDQLFLPYANSMDADNLKKRVTLKIHAGLYLLSDSIKLPPNVNLIGDGADKTVFRQTANFPVFETINGEGIAAQTTSLNQANLLNIQGITLESYLNNAGLKLASCKNSQFTDVKIKGPWTQGTAVNNTQIGILMEATSTPVTTKDNSFEKITIEGFSYGILSNHDVLHNVFNNTTIDTCGFGVNFGRDTVLGQVAQATGPINNTITNSRFININQNGIYVKVGKGNISEKNNFVLVGNDAGVDTSPVHAVIRLDVNGNTSSEDYFARTEALMANSATLNGVAYIPEVQGVFSGALIFATKFTVGQLLSATRVAKLPADTSKHYKVEYTYNSSVLNAFRSGTLDIAIDKNADTITLNDEYDFLGDSANNTNTTRLNFAVSLSDEDGNANKETVIIEATNPTPNANDSATITFKVRSIA